jgi:ATP-dependent exoDNAse (exonuclease V) beta subunit
MRPDIQHTLEEDMARFRDKPPTLASAEERSIQDMIRFYYVAYSRAKYALILLTRGHDLLPGEGKNSHISLGGKNITWFKRRVVFL